MSAHSSIPTVDTTLFEPQVVPAAEEYATLHTTPPTQAVADVRRRTQQDTPVPKMLGGTKESRLLEVLALSMGARRVLEIGTFTGATALALAEVLGPELELVTIENDEAIAEMARETFAASPVGDRIELHVGDARAIAAELEGPFDLIFIDAWKSHYVDYYETLLPKLAPRGVIVADDVVWYGMPFNPAATDTESEGIRDFVRHVHEDPRTHNVMLTVEAGLLLIWHAPATRTGAAS